MRLEWTGPAVDSLRAIHDYIGRDHPAYAARFIDRLTKAAEVLVEFPEIGRSVPEAGRDDIREIIFQGYRIIYLKRSECVRVISVVHGSRDLSALGRKTSPEG